MGEEELKRKISEIIDSSVDDWATRDRRGRIQVHVSTIADILVKAGLKFDASISHTATFDLLQQNRINELEKRIAEAEHRAEVAEKAFSNCIEKFVKFQYEQNGYQLDKIFLEEVNKKCLQQAEKELQEEEKDG